MANTTTRKEEERLTGGAGDKMKKAQEAGTEVVDKAKEAVKTAGEAVGEAADSGASTVGGGLKSLAGTIRDKAPHEGMLGDAASTVAKGLESGGKYLQQEGVTGMVDDLSDLIRKNPIPAVLIGVGVGFLIAQMLPRS